MADTEAASAALLRHPYGIFLVGSRNGDAMNLMTANWGTQCSFEPRLYTVFIQNDAHTRTLIDGGGVFSICFVAPDSGPSFLSFYTKPANVVGDKLGEHGFFEGPETGVPIYDGSVAWFECRVTESRPVGDHIQYIGEVVNGGTPSDEAAWTLQELGWDYGG